MRAEPLGPAMKERDIEGLASQEDQVAADYSRERILAGQLLNASAGAATGKLDEFSGWLLGGFGAILAVGVASADEVVKHLQPEAVWTVLAAFAALLTAAVGEKYLATVVASAVEAAAASAKLSKGAADGDEEDQPELKFSVVVDEMQRATFWPASLIVGRSVRLALAGDFARSGRLVARLVQLQAVLVLVQVACVLWALSAVCQRLVA